MKTNLRLLLVLSLLCIYALLELHIPEVSEHGPLTRTDISEFVNFSQSIYLWIGISLFSILAFGSTEDQNADQSFRSSRVWLGGLFTILGTSSILVLIFNPIGAFTWNMNHVAKPEQRLVKPYLYRQLNFVPNIIFLGTSISDRIPAQEYAQQFSLTGFNFSMAGGTPVDYFTLTNLIVSTSPPGKQPAVILTEILSPGLSPYFGASKYYEQYPIEDTRYMPTEFALETIAVHIDKMFTFSSFSKMVLAEYFVWNKRARESSTFKPDGAGGLIPPTRSVSIYREAVIKSGIDLNKLLQCKELNPKGQELILKMVALGKEQHISMIFYRWPINDDFYTLLKKKPAIYKACAEQFNRFMIQIQAENPNVFYVDLSNYPPVSSAGKALYRDSHHLNSVGSDRVLDILRPTVQAAIQQARSR